ncbi:MAG: VOC family protein [Actinomycetota bacterium]|nr:VOC family protein [Actinomycetota bacterium]
MGERARYEPGTFTWVDLSTSDAEGAKRFYGDLFGWEAEDMPAGDGAIYSMCRLRARYVAGISEQGEPETRRGMPPHWNNYVTVDDLEAATERARALGGNVLAEPFDVLDAGRMAVIQDPAGATFMLWQARRHIGAGLVNEPGCLTWNDLSTPDPDAAMDFYRGLFGWRAEAVDAPGADYWVWYNGERTNGGMLRITERMPGVPPNWMPYFAVDSVDEALGTVESGGGRRVAGPNEVPYGRFVVATDPQGAHFAVYEGEFDD